MAAPTEELTVRIRWEGEVCVVHLAGALDPSSGEFVRDALQATTQATPQVVVDMSEVSFVDVRGLAALTTTIATANADGSAVELRGWPLTVDRVADALPPAGSWHDVPADSMGDT